MAEVHIRDLDPAVLEQLKARAESHRRSLAGEIATILEKTLTCPPKPANREEFLEIVAEMRAHTTTRPQTDSAVLVREDRER